MYNKILVICILSIALFSFTGGAQNHKIIEKEYSVIFPSNYKQNEKRYPLVVCYQNQATDSMFQQFSTNKQIIILQFEPNANATVNTEFVKQVILKVLHQFSIPNDKIYLLGVNQNINITARISGSMNYYFAATAYLTNNSKIYADLKDSLKSDSSVRPYYNDSVNYEVLDSIHEFFHQKYLWSNQVLQMSDDASRLDVAYQSNMRKWKISLSYGRWYFDNSAKAQEISLLNFPKSMGALDLSFSRLMNKHWSLNARLAVLIKKLEPASPDVIDIINGSNVDVEGGGVILMPISIGVDYHLLKKRLSPYVGISMGNVAATYKYVEALGNISDGINRNESKFKSNAPFIEFSTGITYRSSDIFHYGIDFGINKSKDYKNNIGGNRAFNGYKISLFFSILL